MRWAGGLVLANVDLEDTKASLAAAKSPTAKLDRKVESMASQIDSLEDEKSDLETQNASLNSAMIGGTGLGFAVDGRKLCPLLAEMTGCE